MILRFLLEVLDKYGMDAVQIALIGYFGWRIVSNHLKHITDKINSICNKLDVFQNELNKTKERVSHLEGQLDS